MRSGPAPRRARRLLNPLPIAQALEVVRAFSYFSHLANIAEDVHQNRRRRAHALAGVAAAARQTSRMRSCRLARRGVDRAKAQHWLDDALVSPVLTAHPTEVQRKSILDVEREIARAADVARPDDADARRGGRIRARGLHTRCSSLWQTAMLRLSRLQVHDEIDNGLAYYRYTFLDEIPRLYACVRDALAAASSASSSRACRRSCAWARGSAAIATAIRTSTADTLDVRDSRARRRRASSTTSTKCIASAPSCRCRRGSSRRRLSSRRWRRRRSDANPHRQDEPYRQALIGVYARLAATARALTDLVAGARDARRARAVCERRRVRRGPGHDRRVARVARRASARGAAARSAAARRRRVRLPPRGRSTCGRTATCTRRSSPSCSRGAGVVDDYAALDEAARVALLVARARAARGRCIRRHLRLLRAHARASSRSCAVAARRSIARYGAAALPNYVISKCQSVSDLLEVARAAEGGRACCATSAAGRQHRAAVRDDRRPRRDAATTMRAALALPLYRALRREPRPTGRR